MSAPRSPRRSVAGALRSAMASAARRPWARGLMERTVRELQAAIRPSDSPVDPALVAAAETATPGQQPRSALNRLCRPDAWDDPTWLMYNRILGLPDGDHRFHRKAFEWTHCVYGLERLGCLGPEARVLGVAAGHECVLYYLANRAGEVVATDLYQGSFVGGPAGEADPMFLSDPARFAPFPYRHDALRPMAADALHLPFKDDEFDVVYSLSSIEHFGGHEGSARGMREMARVLRPGGVLCVSTEWLLEGGDHHEYFTPAAFSEHVLGTPGLQLIGDLDDTPPPSELIANPVWLDGDIDRTPQLVMGLGALRWTSVIVFLRKLPGAA